VGPAFEALRADGTVELVNGHLIIPRFLEAQESRKTNTQSKREQREKSKAVARATEVLKTSTPHRQTTADGGRSGHPPAQLSSAQLVPVVSSAPHIKRAVAGTPEPPKAEKPPDPRHQPLVAKLTEAYRRKRGTAYPFEPRDAKTVQKLLGRKPAEHAPEIWPVVLLAAWERALDSQYPGCSTLSDFDKQLPKHLGAGPPNGSAARAADAALGTGPVVAKELAL
jgi:hypothetical protein